MIDKDRIVVAGPRDQSALRPTFLNVDSMIDRQVLNLLRVVERILQVSCVRRLHCYIIMNLIKLNF